MLPVFYTSTPHNILSKPLAALLHNNSQNNGQQWERNEFCQIDYHQKEYWPGRWSNQRPPVLKSCMLLTEPNRLGRLLDHISWDPRPFSSHIYIFHLQMLSIWTGLKFCKMLIVTCLHHGNAYSTEFSQCINSQYLCNFHCTRWTSKIVLINRERTNFAQCHSCCDRFENNEPFWKNATDLEPSSLLWNYQCKSRN